MRAAASDATRGCATTRPNSLSRGRRSNARARASPRAMATDGEQKVVVVGGSGFVGSRVCAALRERGCAVTSVSKSGAAVEGASSAIGVDLADASNARDALRDSFAGADCVVSCVGVIGADDAKMRAGNGDYNVVVVEAAKAAGVRRFVYVSVASIVPDVVGGVAMKGYFEGKTMAEDAIRANYDASEYVIVKPSFIYGGDAFSLTPPRVTKTYGDALAKVLGSGPVKALAAKAPGPIALTLAEPVSVEDVAGACVAGALGMTGGESVIDGTDAIKACAAKL